MDNNVALSIVIVSWNTKKLVSECLQSLENCRRSVPMDIILVDNASSDGTVELVREQFPDLRLMRNDANVGFARANNIGINLSTSKYVCLINSDVQVSEVCLQSMLEYMEHHPDIGMLGPKMVLPDGSVGQSCMRFPTVWNWLCRALALDTVFKGSKMFGDFLMSDFKYDRITDVEALTGWFWMVRREAIDQVGLLDERFFMYGEDIDWPKRFHQGGWRVVFYPEAEAFHHCAASSSSAPTRFYIEMNRANMQYFRRHHNRLAVVGFWLAILVHELVRITGYGIVYVFQRRVRESAGQKVRRSVACFLWLMKLRTAEEAH
jgi:GT2 family glycosyltransferase